MRKILEKSGYNFNVTAKIEQLVGEIHRTENAVEELKKNTYSRKINTNSMLLAKIFLG